ncbi:hypothetical protein AHF37_02035 [Paragonimus kellicotti]|nr:hypothetical protein AHF37_02035 [Paragonimus kellicotti]
MRMLKSITLKYTQNLTLKWKVVESEAFRSVAPHLCYSATASGLPRPNWTVNFNTQSNNSVLNAPPLCRRASSLSYRSSCASPHSGNASSGCSTPTGTESDSPRFPISNSPHASQAVRPIGMWRNLRSVTPLNITKPYSKIDSMSQPGIHTNSAHDDENHHILPQTGGSDWPVLAPGDNLKQCQLPSTIQPRNIASFSQQTAINSQQRSNGEGSLKYIESMQTGVRATFSGNAHNQMPVVKPASRKKCRSTEKDEMDQEPTRKLVVKTNATEVSLDAAVPLPMSTLSRPLYSKRSVKDAKLSSGLVDKCSSQMAHPSFPPSSTPHNIPISTGSVKPRLPGLDMHCPLVISGRASEPRSFPQRSNIATPLAGTHSVAVAQMSCNHTPAYMSTSPEVPISMYVGGETSKLARQMPIAGRNHTILPSNGNTNVVESATHVSYSPVGSMNLELPQHNIEVSNYADSPSRHITSNAQMSVTHTSLHTFRLPPKGSSLDEISAMTHNPALTASCKLTSSKQHSVLPTSNSAASNLSAADEKQFCDSGISSSSYSKDSACTSPSDQPKQNDHLMVSTVSPRTSNFPSSSQRCCSRTNPNVQYDVPDSSLESGFTIVSKYSENTTRAKSTEPCILLGDRLGVIDNGSKIQRPSALSQSPTSTTSNLPNLLDPKMLSRQRARELYSLVKTRDELRLASREGNRSQPILSKASSVPLEPRPVQPQNWSTRPQTLIKTYPTNPTASCVGTCGSNSQLEEPKYAVSSDTSDCLMSSRGNCYQRKEAGLRNDDITYTNITYSQSKALCDPDRSRLVSAGQFYEPSKERCGALLATSKTFNDHGEVTTQSRRVNVTPACGQRDVNGKPPTSQGGKQKGEITPKFRRDLEESIDQFLSETKIADQNFPDPSASHEDRTRRGSSTFSKSTTSASSASFQPDHFDRLTGNPLDPDQLLSSLSKLTLDSNNKNNFWDENYYLSDVESEYAALELLLPFRNSTEHSAYAEDGDSGLLSTRKDAEKSKEVGYLSDTETLFQVQKVPRPSTAMGSFADRHHHMNNLFAPSGNCGKLPVASVAPMMATSRQLQVPATSTLSSAVCTSNEGCFQEDDGQTMQSATKENTMTWDPHTLLDADMPYGLEELKWPRLKSAQSVAHSLSAERSVGLSGGSVLTVGSSEVFLNKPSMLETVKLPYPKISQMNSQSSGICSAIQSVRPCVSNYAIHEKSADLLELVDVTDQPSMNSTLWTGEADLTTSDNSTRIQRNHMNVLEAKQEAQKETTTEKNIQMMTTKIHQLTTMNELKVNNLDPKTGWTNRRFTGSKWTRTPSPCVTSKSLKCHSAVKERSKTSSQITTIYGCQPNSQSVGVDDGKDKFFRSPLDPDKLMRQEMASETPQLSGRKHSTRLSEPEIRVPVSSGYIRFKLKDEEPPCAVVLPMPSRSDCTSTTKLSKDETGQDEEEHKPVCSNPPITLQAACELVATVVPMGNCELINTSSDKLAQKETTTEKNIQMMTTKIHQLTTMNELKDTEIYELHNTVNQLRADMHRLQLIQEAGSVHHKPTLPLLQQQLLRPPRSPSYRGVLENATPQELMDTMSLNSLTSAASTCSQDTGCTTATKAGPERSPTPNRAKQADSEPGSGKRSRWAQKETTTEKNIQMMTTKIHQLTTMNELKDTEIYELHNTVNQLRADMHRLQLIQEAGSVHHKPTLPLLQQQLLRPPRSPSYRGVLENATPQELMDTMSLNSLTSAATSTCSQDTGCTTATKAGPERSPTPNRAKQADSEPGSGKRSRWVRPSLGKAFKKRSRSSMDSGDRDGDSLSGARSVSSSCGSTATVLTNPGGPWTGLAQSNEKLAKSSNSLEIASPQPETNDDVHEMLMKMRWEMHCLEADNHRLRRLVFNSPHLGEPQDVIDRVPQNSVDLSNLCSRYCDNAVYIVPVFVDTDFRVNGGVEIGNPVEQMASVEGLRLDNKQFISSNPGKLVRIGRVGIRPNSSWCDLDYDMANLFESSFFILYSSSCGSTATVLTNPGGPWTGLAQSNEKLAKSSNSLEIASPQPETNDDVHEMLMKMRWEMHCLEADNHRLRRLVFNSPHLGEPQDVIDRVPQNSVDLSNLCSRYCDNAVYIVPVFVDTDFRVNGGVEIGNPVEQMASVEGLRLDNKQFISSNPGKLVRIGRVGIRPNSSWCDLDYDMANLFETVSALKVGRSSTEASTVVVLCTSSQCGAHDNSRRNPSVDCQSSLYCSSCGSTATVLTNPGGPWTGLAQSNEKLAKSSNSLEIASPQPETNDDVHEMLMKMRWEMHCLEADNHRLRRLVFNSPHLGEPQDVIDRVPQNSVDLSNLCSRYCDNAVYIVPVFVDTDFRVNGGVEIGNPVEQMASVEGLRLDNKQFISSNPGKLVRIGRVGIRPNSSWCDLDYDMANLFEDYLRFIDPDKRLGLEPVKMIAYQLRCYTSGRPNSPDLTRSVLRFRSETSRTDMLFQPANNELEETLPKVWVERGENAVVDGNIEMLTILCLSPVQHMKLGVTGDHESNLELLAFETLLPVNMLRAYQSVVHTHRFNVLCGPIGTGKSKIARKMAASIWRNSGTDNKAISKFSIKPNGSSTVEDILSFVEDSLDVNSQKDVMVLENLHNIHGAVEQLVETLFRKYSDARLTILATSDFRNKEMDSLQEKGMIRVLEHLSDIDDTTEFLACYLRRKLVQTRLAELNNTEFHMQLTGLVHDQQILTQLISWIPKVWKYLNRLFLSSLQTQCPTVISLRVFLSCPIDVRASRKWFTDLWNNLFIPFLFRARSTEQMLQSQSMALSASLDWIMATWPWPRATTDLMLQTPYMSHSITNPLHSPVVEGSPSSPSDCFLNTFGVPKSNSTAQKHRGLENRSSLDSGIVPDGYPTTNVSVGASNLHCEAQPFTGPDLSERLTVNHLLAEVRNSDAVSREAIGYMMTNLTSHV